jgi:hypothetical protein
MQPTGRPARHSEVVSPRAGTLRRPCRPYLDLLIALDDHLRVSAVGEVTIATRCK